MVVVDERDILWQTHSAIHELLNRTYLNSKTFVDKTFAYQRPSYRVLAYNSNDELIAHHAGFCSITTNITGKDFVLCGLGLYAVLPQQGISTVAIDIYKETLKQAKNLGYQFAITLSCNEVVVKISEKHLGAIVLDIPVRGLGGYSKRTDKIIVVGTEGSKALNHEAKSFIEILSKENELILNSELF